MANKITRTFKLYTVTIKSGETGEVLEQYTTGKKVDKKTVAIKYIKETGNVNFIIDIQETEELRAMDLDFFLANSELVTKDESENV